MRNETIVGCLLLVAAGCRAETTEVAAPTGHIYFLTAGAESHDASPLYRVQADGQGLERLTAEENAFVSDLHGRLALTIDHDIVIADANLKTRQVVAGAPGFDWHPQFSPDGAWVLFESARSSFRDLYKANVATGELVRLTDNREGNFDAAWSPDSTQIAFASSRHGQLDVFVMNSDGSHQVRLTSHPGDAIKPAWSPDGTQIAFISGRDARDELYVVRPDGTDLKKVGEAPSQGRVDRFMWHPKTSVIVYSVRAIDEGAKLHIANVDKGRSWQLSTKSDDDFDPCWSPNGSHLVFVSKRDGQNQLFLMREDGSRRTRLDVDARDVWLPRWFETTNVKGSNEA